MGRSVLYEDCLWSSTVCTVVAPTSQIMCMVLARRSEVWMVMISCIDCTQKDTYVVKFPPQLQGRQRVTSYRLSKPPTTPMPEEPRQAFPDLPETPLPCALVTTDDVLDMHLFLKAFNGDFQRLFAETE